MSIHKKDPPAAGTPRTGKGSSTPKSTLGHHGPQAFPDARELKSRLTPDDVTVLILPHLDAAKMRPGGRKGKCRCLYAGNHANGDVRPSMEIDLDAREPKHLLWCPVCNARFDVFDALQQIHHCEFIEAKRMVEEHLGHSSPRPNDQRRTAGRAKAAPKSKGFIAGSLEEIGRKVAKIVPGDHEPTAYEYVPTFVVVRLDESDETKTFRPVHQQADGRWYFGDPSGPSPLYGLNKVKEQITAGWPIWVAEGEKCANALLDVDLMGTCSAHGTKAAARTDWTPLAGTEVVICQDNDAPGVAYGQAVTEILLGLDPPAKVRRLTFDHLEPGQDVADEIAAALVKYAGDEQGAWRAAHDDLQARADEVKCETQPEPPPEVGPVIVRLCEVEPQPLKWLWEARVPEGKLPVIAGNPGLGKSLLTIDMMARVSRGTAWPDSPGVGTKPGDVVLISAEDDVADTIRPRLDAAGADVDHIVALEAIRKIDTETGESYQRAFCLETDLPALEKAILSLSDYRLVVIDPITAFLGRTDSHKNAELRGLLAPLSALAARHKVAVVAISHLNKNAGVAAVYRTMGSIAFVAAARAAHVVVRDEANKKRRLFLAVKSNLAEEVDGLAYSIVGSPGDTKIAMVEWESEPVTMSADEALSVAAGAGGPDTPERDAAADWLRLALGDGEVPAKEVMRQAKENAIAIKTLRRAATEIGVKIYKEGFQGEWKWSLCDEDGQAQKQGAPSPKMATASPLPSKMAKRAPIHKGRASLDNGGHLWTLPSKDGGDAGSQGAKDGQPLGIGGCGHLEDAPEPPEQSVSPPNNDPPTAEARAEFVASQVKGKSGVSLATSQRGPKTAQMKRPAPENGS